MYKRQANYSDFSQAKKEVENGQFFTPPALCEFVAACLQVSESDIIADLTCGMAVSYTHLYAPASPLPPFGGIGKSICLTGMVPNSPCCWIVMRAFILARHTGFISRKMRARLWEILIWMPPFLPIHFWAMRRYRYQTVSYTHLTPEDTN